jgi:2-polyprenyl-6-methoxyphenol hydroxylase-like FAD-dependent oxidoreductase
MRTVDVLIVGAGATGLYLSNLLKKHHIEHRVIDAKAGPSSHSRSIGIHPASFPLMEEIGVMEAIRREAVSVRQGQAWTAGRRLGVLPLGEVLTLPQHRTEAILEAGAAPVEYGVRFLGYQHEGERLRVSTSEGEMVCQTVLGCDGMHSAVRGAMGVAGEVVAYPFEFFMADMRDNTGFGSDAAIFLHPDGMTESFPLSGGQRRWVVMRRGDESPDLDGLLREIRLRTGLEPDPSTHTMFSAFKAYRHIAPILTDKNVFLVGDAAHVTSPIGGQGMNLGWLNARDLIRHWDAPATYQRVAQARARRVIARAEFNMRLGGTSSFHRSRTVGVFIALHSPLKRWLTRRFTMRDL